MSQELNLPAKEAKLKAWLRTKLPQAEDLSISPLQGQASGFSSETYFFELQWLQNGEKKVENLVLRQSPARFQLFPEYKLELQYRVMRHLEGSGVPVPKMYWFEEGKKVLGTPFFIMGKVEGEVCSDYPPGIHGHGLFYEATPERRRELWWRAVEVMAKIHSLDWKTLGLSFPGVPEGGTDAIDRQIAVMERWLEYGARESLPVLRAGFDWVKKNRFDPSRVCLCWGDPRPSNLIYRDDKVVAVLDWEMAHIGPPEFDLAYFLFCDEVSSQSTGIPRLQGLPGEKEIIRYYEGLTGRKVENFFYHQVFQALRWAVLLVLGAKNIAERGMPGFPPDLATNNFGYRKLAELLEIRQS